MKISTGIGATLALTVTEVAGNITVCDPAVPGIVHRTLHGGVQRVGGLTALAEPAHGPQRPGYNRITITSFGRSHSAASHMIGT